MNKKTIKTLEILSENKLVKKENLPKLKKVIDNFSFSITNHMYNLIDPNNSKDPIAKQFIPSIEELYIAPNEQQDPIGDNTHTSVKGIIHRYPDRCLFTPVLVCPVYCRFCFRKEKVGTSAPTLTPQEIEQALNYINEHKEIWEVIFTGGDPFILKPATLKNLMIKLNAIQHIEVIRIHTRVPIVDPTRINLEMVAALKSNKAVYVVLHANHSQEFTAAAKQACSQLIDAGIPMLSQTILLKNLNDDINILSELMRCFIRNRIKPYYLHHADLVQGTKHFRTSITKGQQLMKQLRGRFSGLCQPTYVLDIPGGYGKMPIGPNYLNQQDNTSDFYIEDYQGNQHFYPNEKD